MALGELTKPALTPRETQIAALVAEGLTNREIAGRLRISERTADRHLEHIRQKLGFNSRARIASWYVEQSRAQPASKHDMAPGRPLLRRPWLRIGGAVAALVLLLLGLGTVAFGRLTSPLPWRGPVITTFAGDSPTNHCPTGYCAGGYSGDSDKATSAQLSHPLALAVSGHSVYIADAGNRVIRMVDQGGVIRTVAGGGLAAFADGANATAIKLPMPTALAVTPYGRIFFASGSSLFRIDSDLTIHQVLLPAGGSPLHDIYGLAFDAQGDLYIADRAGNTIRRLAVDGSLTIVAGTGDPGYTGDGMAATGARLWYPTGLALDGAGNLFIADQGNNRVRKVDAQGIITTVAGSADIPGSSGDGGRATRSRLSLPAGILVHNGWLYIADTGNNRVREVSPDGIVTTLAGQGKAAFSGDGGRADQAGLIGPWALAFDPSGSLLISDSGNNRVREVHLAQGQA